MSRVDHRRALWSWVRDLDSNILDRVCSEEGEVVCIFVLFFIYLFIIYLFIIIYLLFII